MLACLLAFSKFLPLLCLHPPLSQPSPHHARRYGLFTALNSTHATWTFKTVQPDGNGPKDYSDALTIIQTNHREANF